MKKTVKAVLLAGVVLAGLAATGYMLLRPVAVRAEPVMRAPAIREFTERGTIFPQTTAAVAAGADGRIAEIRYEVGRRVSMGDVLLQVDDSQRKNELEEQLELLMLKEQELLTGKAAQNSESTVTKEQLQQQLISVQQQYERLFGGTGTVGSVLESAQSSYHLAKDRYDNAQALYEMGSISGMELKSYEDQLALARSALKSAEQESSEQTKAYYEQQMASIRAQISAIEQSGRATAEGTELAKKQVQLEIEAIKNRIAGKTAQAPFDGYIGKLLVEAGEYVSEHQPVAVLYGADDFQIEVSVLEEDGYFVRLGDRVSCVMPDGTTFSGEVVFIAPLVEEKQSSVGLTESRRRIEVFAEDLPAAASIGGQVDITFSSEIAASVQSVLSSAVVPYETGSGVYVIREGKLALAPVETGIRWSGRVEILSGVSEGEWVVTDPYDESIRKGARVQVS